jgi:hypothetical protein
MIPDIEMIPAQDIAKILHTTHGKVLSGILNGTLPIGAVVQENGGRRRGLIPKARWEAWITAQDLSTKER